MKELEEYRTNLVQRLEEAANEFRAECLKVDDPHARQNAEGWTVHQVAVHTRDVNDLVYGLRARRTVVEENPEFPNFDGVTYMAESYNSSEPLDQVLSRLVESVQDLAEFLQALPAEAWSRVSRHTTLGRDLTLQTWVEKDLAHIGEHLETVRKHKNL